MTKISAMVVDGDKTLWEGRALEGICKAYLRQETMKLHLPTVYRAIRGVCEVKAIVKRYDGNVEGEMLGQKRAYEVLVENGLGRKDEMYSFAGSYINGQVIRNVSDLIVEKIRFGIPVFLATASGTSAEMYSMNHFHLKDAVSNKELFDEKGRLSGVELIITNGENKLDATKAMLDGYNMRLGDCVVVGDSKLDIPMLKAAGFPMASPFATDEVKAIRGIVQIRKD